MNHLLTYLLTSAQYRLFSAIQLKAEGKCKIHSKCIKQNKWVPTQKRRLHKALQKNKKQ